MNAITVFVLTGVVGRLLYLIKWQSGNDVITLKGWLMKLFFLSWLEPVNASLAYALSFVFMSWLAMFWLYKKGIFIKV
jgi:predicted acyltransferase